MAVERKATLVDGGSGVLLEVTTTCPEGNEVVEAFVYVNQDGNSSEWGAIPIACDGVPHSGSSEVRTIDFVFHKGGASASGYILLSSGQSISPVFDLKLKKDKE
jgi:hypothetical protein